MQTFGLCQLTSSVFLSEYITSLWIVDCVHVTGYDCDCTSYWLPLYCFSTYTCHNDLSRTDALVLYTVCHFASLFWVLSSSRQCYWGWVTVVLNKLTHMHTCAHTLVVKLIAVIYPKCVTPFRLSNTFNSYIGFLWK